MPSSGRNDIDEIILATYLFSNSFLRLSIISPFSSEAIQHEPGWQGTYHAFSMTFNKGLKSFVGTADTKERWVLPG